MPNISYILCISWVDGLQPSAELVRRWSRNGLPFSVVSVQEATSLKCCKKRKRNVWRFGEVGQRVCVLSAGVGSLSCCPLKLTASNVQAWSNVRLSFLPLFSISITISFSALNPFPSENQVTTTPRISPNWFCSHLMIQSTIWTKAYIPICSRKEDSIPMAVPFLPPSMYPTNGPTTARCRTCTPTATKWHLIQCRKSTSISIFPS